MTPLDFKVEAALLRVIRELPEVVAFQAARPELTVQFIGKHSEAEREVPRVEVVCFNTDHLFQGNHRADVRVMIVSESDQQEPFDAMAQIHVDLAAAVLDGLKRDDLAALMIQAWKVTRYSMAFEAGVAEDLTDGFHVYDDGETDFSQGSDPGVAGRNFVSGEVFQFTCCGTELA